MIKKKKLVRIHMRVQMWKREMMPLSLRVMRLMVYTRIILMVHTHFNLWGINQQADAALTIDFGREVQLDKVGFTWRADFPHDSYWTNVTIQFDDGTSETFATKKQLNHNIFHLVQERLKAIRFVILFKRMTHRRFLH